MNIIEISNSRILEYEKVPISFIVESILDVELVDHGLGGIRLIERPVQLYRKDYDAYGSPAFWQEKFNLNNWGIFLALDGDLPIGGVAMALNTNGVTANDSQNNLAVLWDIRVLPERRRAGIGRSLFEIAVNWSKSKGCAHMKIETQNTNVNACRFYAAMGANLGDIIGHAYCQEQSLAAEIQMNWYYEISN